MVGFQGGRFDTLNQRCYKNSDDRTKMIAYSLVKWVCLTIYQKKLN